MIRAQLNEAQLKHLRRELKKAELPPAKRQRLLWRIAKRGLIPLAKRHVKNQSSPDGQAWPARKNGKRKMLTKLPRLLGVREDTGAGTVTLSFSRGDYKTRSHGGRVAYVQQHGTTINMNASMMRGNGGQQQGKPATRGQARKLLALGYVTPTTPDRGEDGRYRTPATRAKKRKVSQGWIMDNLSMPQAGLLIRQLRGDTPKKSWTITLPARAFLGASDEDFSALLARELRGIQYGYNVKKQDIKR